jgi:hypothetical protein
MSIARDKAGVCRGSRESWIRRTGSPVRSNWRREMSVTKTVVTAIACCASVFATTVAQADINVPGLACQAPFLDQAFPMRWHEHYILNPRGNQTTWVVCPLSFESSGVPQNFAVYVSGVKQPGTTSFHRCYVNFIDIANQDIPGVVDNPGQNFVATYLLPNSDQAGQRWVSAQGFTIGGVTGDVGSACGPACWTISVNCELPGGFALQMVSLIGTN